MRKSAAPSSTASVVASYNVESFSCDRLRDLTLEEIEEQYREFTAITCF